MPPGDLEHLMRTSDEVSADVSAVSGVDACPAVQDIESRPAGDIGRCSRGWQATKLFGTDRNPGCRCEALHTVGIDFGLTVIAGAKADQAAAYQDCFFSGHGLILLGLIGQRG